MTIQKIISGNVYRNGGGVTLVANTGNLDNRVKKITPPIMTTPKDTNSKIVSDFPDRNP